ncbi:MAG: hypothetical protein AAFN93_05385 [Bacteroidota bacterium]
MTEKLTKLVLFFLVSVSISLTANCTYAQEGGLILGDPIQEKPKVNTPSEESGDFDIQELPNASKALSIEQRTHTLTPSLDQSKSIKSDEAKKSVVKAVLKEEKKVVEEEESVLTFNFLYYIIQKFKFDEVIDQ